MKIRSIARMAHRKRSRERYESRKKFWDIYIPLIVQELSKAYARGMYTKAKAKSLIVVWSYSHTYAKSVITVTRKVR